MYKEALQTQRDNFRVELDRVNERLYQLNAQSPTCENEITSSETQKYATNKRPTQDAPKASIPGPSTSAVPTQDLRETTPTSGPSQPIQEKQHSYAAIVASKPAQAASQPWIKVSYKNRKNGSKKPVAQSEQRGHRILFPRKDGSQFKSEADIMLALNEALQKAGVESKTRFIRVKYAPSGSISAFLTEKSDATMLLPQRSNMLIRAAKAIDDVVIGIEILEHWHRLKVHRMSLDRYLGPGNMELLKREVESSTGISLKTIPCWLINKNRLREQQENNNKRGSAIVITVSNEMEAKRLLASGLRFGGAIKKVEKY